MVTHQELLDLRVAQNTGGSIIETTLVAVVVGALCCLLTTTKTNSAWIPRLAVEVLIVWCGSCCIFNSTGITTMGLLAAGLIGWLYWGSRSKISSSATSTGGYAETTIDKNKTMKAEWSGVFTLCRGGLMFLTVLSILAADFNFFPKRFLKTEEFGISLMDTGVGSFALIAGTGASRAASMLHTWTPKGRSQCRKFVFPAIPLIAIGMIRVWVLSTSDLKQHVTEYGRHWNFFFTLAAAPQLYFAAVIVLGKVRNTLTGGALERDVVSGKRATVGVPPAVLSLLLLSIHEALLYGLGWNQLILSPYRDDMFTANKEGTCTIIAYAAIFALGVDVGTVVRQATSGRSLRNTMSALTAVGAVMFWLTSQVETPSRRLANAPFVFHTLFFNCLVSLVVCTFQSNYRPSKIINALSTNEMLCFVGANLLTGAVNVSISAIDLSWYAAHSVLLVYISFICCTLCVLHHFGIQIRYKR